ncbi:PREDICTED: uncharacterized protein LOC106101941 isoform X2 [Papilio polytes]|uniref:uncharacterized protein LOC106101941 isoform X2 n=1 Tax=Papilio polytes TaxID=76194 RepID=UPI0006764DF8|nr:PREDICTED: uncharacterized protein LOC106101941 isoform X2 [Papilio polytes]
MKRNKAINVTKRDIRSAIVEDRNYCYHYYPENARTHVKQTPLGYNYNFKDLDLQNVSNWSHLTCSCRDSLGKYQEASYFTTKLKQMPPKVTDIGVGNVKAYQRRKAKRIYVPQTEERAVGTSINDYPKCHHFNDLTHKTTRNVVERVANKKHLLNKKLSPLVRKKSNYTNPLTTFFRKQDLEHNVNTTPSVHNQVNASTQMGTKEIEKSTKIKIFKELATNTEILENGKPLKSEVELSVEMSRILSNKMGTGSSLDSLVQHVYNLDKPCNATLSTATIDPMENKLEREYRKIFSNQSKDCSCNNKISAANSDSLLRRFEALRRDMTLKEELKKNMSKSSSPTNEPKYKDISVDSDGASLPEINDKKLISPITSDYSDARQKEKGKKKSTAKLQKSSYWRRSDVDSDHQTKGRFKLWGRKVSVDGGSHKKSKIKCTESKKKSEASVKFSKLLKTKSSVKKEGKKFRFFKKKVKAVPRSRTDVMTGRCEVREGMSVQIGKGLLSQDYNTNAIQKFRLKYEDKLLNAWIRNFLTKSDEPRKKISTQYSSSVESSSTDIGENSSSDTDVQLTTTPTVTNNSSLHKVNKSPFINFSNQYIQAWMLTKTILDRFNDTEELKKVKRSYSADILQDNEIDATKTCNAVGIEIATQKNLEKINYPVYDISTESGDDLEGTVYLLPKTYKASDVYLQKLYHNWNPLDLDLWCISDTNLQPSYNPHTHKDINLKSYSNMTDDIQYTTLVSSCETFGKCGKDKRKKSLLKSHNNDYLTNNIGIRITPKDSLEVCKKRKLYSDSNKGRWKHDELSVSLSSSTKSKHFRKLISLKPNKKRVTISNYEVDKESKSILKENDIRKKNLQCLSSSCHVSDSMQTGRIAGRLYPRLEKKPTRQNIAITATSSGMTNNPCENAEVKCLKSASKENLLSNTDSCITNWKKHLCCDTQDEDRKTCEKINDTKSGFFSDYFKPSSLIKNKYHSICRKFVTDKKSSEESVKNSQNSKCRHSDPNLRDQIKSEYKKCAITTDVQKLSTLPTSVEDKSCGAPGTDLDMNRRGKLIGLHFKKQPVRKNVSRACWTAGDAIECNNGDSTDNTTKLSSKETTGLTHKCPHTNSTVSKNTNKEIKNIVVNKEIDNDENNKEIVNKNKMTPCVIRKNIEIDPNPPITSESGKRICLGIDTCNDDPGNDKSDCDFIEIVFKIRCKHGEDRAMIVNIKDSKDRILKDNRINLCERDSDINSKNKEVYLFQNESANSILRKNSKNCMNVKILIKNCKNDESNKRKDLKGNSNISINSKKITERLQSISSETIKAVNNYAYSVHKFTIDLTKSVNHIKSIASKENYTILHSNNKGTIMSESDFQKNINMNSNEISDNRSNGKIQFYNSKTNSRKSKHRTKKIKNEKLYYSSATLRPYRRYSLTKQMSNYKHLKNRVLQKIVDCAKDFNKGIKKEKRKGSSVMPTMDYSNRNVIDQNVNRLSKEIKASTLYSHFLNATSSYGYCHFDSVVRVRPKSNVNNYLFTVETKDRHKKSNSSYSTKYEKRKHTKILATKLGLTDIRRRQARRSVRNSENYHRRVENMKKLNQFLDENDNLDFLYTLSKYNIDRRCELNCLKQKCKNATQTDGKKNQKSKHDNINLSKLKIHRLNKGMFCISDERKITIVSSKFLEEKCISCHETGLEETCNRKEMFDIFQLTEMKKAVFEMYNSTDFSNKSKSLVKLPKFKSDVENALII